MSKKLKSKKKEEFLKRYSLDLIQKHNAKIYPSFVKISLNGKEYDYYPGAERIAKVNGKSFTWQDLTHQQFLKIWNCD